MKCAYVAEKIAHALVDHGSPHGNMKPHLWFCDALTKNGSVAKNSCIKYLSPNVKDQGIQEAKIDEIVRVLSLLGIGFRREWFAGSMEEFRNNYAKFTVEPQARSDIAARPGKRAADKQPGTHKALTYPDLWSDKTRSNVSKPILEQRHAKYRAIAGVYQIIRPHSSSADRYILEIMAIVPADAVSGCVATIFMFSHRLLGPTSLYEGPFVIGHQRCATAMLRRPNERDSDGWALRCLILDIDMMVHESNRDEYKSRPCLSGIMLRGVAAENRAHKAVSVPFVAIRASESGDLCNPGFNAESKSIQVHTTGVSVGEIDERARPLSYAFCDHLFPKSGTSAQAIETLSPRKVENLVNPLATTEDEYFKMWSDICARDIADKKDADAKKRTNKAPRTTGRRKEKRARSSKRSRR